MFVEAISVWWKLAGFDLSLFGTEELVGQFIHFVSIGSCRIQVPGKQLYFVKQLIRGFPGLTKLAESLLVCAVLLKNFRAPSFPRSVSALTMSQPVKACNPIKASHMLSPNELASFRKSMNRVYCFFSHF